MLFHENIDQYLDLLHSNRIMNDSQTINKKEAPPTLSTSDTSDYTIQRLNVTPQIYGQMPLLTKLTTYSELSSTK